MEYWTEQTDADMHRLLREQFLTGIGWVRSVETRSIVNEAGPVPWFTYPATRYLSSIAKPDWSVFEYGVGASTAWRSSRARWVAGVEHDAEWAARARQASPEAMIMHVPAEAPHDPQLEHDLASFHAAHPVAPSTGDPDRDQRAGLLWAPYIAYAAAIADFGEERFDVVVVDGMARALCAAFAARWIKFSGVIVFDNADRDVYAPAYALLRDAGFVRIDFWGLGPLNPYEWCTSLFVRDLTALSGGAA